MLMGKGGDMSEQLLLTITISCFFLIGMASGIFMQYSETEKYKAMAHEFCLSASGGEENVCKEVLK